MTWLPAGLDAPTTAYHAGQQGAAVLAVAHRNMKPKQAFELYRSREAKGRQERPSPLT